MGNKKLSELAKTIRSKNAGVNKITFDIIFREATDYELVKRSQVLTRSSVAALFNIPEERIADFVEYDPANAIKFTIYRNRPSGSPGDPDIFGAQQYAPLLDIDVPSLSEIR
jgi:transcription initiation factor IIE alpha subunit